MAQFPGEFVIRIIVIICFRLLNERRLKKKDDGIAYRDSHKWNFIDSQSIVSMNFWGFTPGVFSQLETQFTQFLKQYGQELKSEFYIPFVVSEIISEGETNVKVLKSEYQWFGVTYKEDKEKAISSINTLVQQGVYPCKIME